MTAHATGRRGLDKGFERSDGNVLIRIRKSGHTVVLATNKGEIPIQQYEGDYTALQ